MTRPLSVKQQLLRLYRSNVEGARQLGQTWAVDHYESKIRELSQRGSGALPRWARLDAERFGGLITWPDRRS